MIRWIIIITGLLLKGNNILIKIYDRSKIYDLRFKINIKNYIKLNNLFSFILINIIFYYILIELN